MTRRVKEFVRRFRYGAGVVCTFSMLFILVMILVKGSVVLVEANTPWLLVEVAMVGAALILQLVPLQD